MDTSLERKLTFVGRVSPETWRSPTGAAVAALMSAVGVGCVIPLSTTALPGADGGATDSSATSADAALEASIPPGKWSNVTKNLANKASGCGNLTGVFAKPDEDLLIAGIALDGLWASGDGGMSWHALGTSSGSAQITNRPSALVFDPQVSTRYWESGIYGGGVYETENDGNTFTELGNVVDCDLVSVDFSDPNRQTLVAGGHEAPQSLYRSGDGGMMWTSIGSGLPGSTNCTNPLVVDSQTYLVGCGGFGGGPTGIYRTIDSGMMWKNVSTSGGTSAPLRASNGSIYWASADGRGLARSTDNGETWTDVALTGVINSVHPIELPDGRLATIGPQYVMVSGDHGTTWAPASASLPYNDAGGVAYSAQEEAFFVWHADCGNVVLSDAIMRFDFDYHKY